VYRLLGGVKGGTINGGNFKSAILNFMKVQQIFSRRCLVTDDLTAGCVLQVTLSCFLKEPNNHTLAYLEAASGGGLRCGLS